MQTRKTYSKDVQLLLWAVAEARARSSSRGFDRSLLREDVDLPTGQADFFTEWQPATR